MNFAGFELFPCLLPAKQNNTEGMKEINKVQTHEDGTSYLSSGYLKEFNVQNL